jgi:hypothetical protein
MFAQLSTIFGYVAGAVIFVATIFMLRAIFSGPKDDNNDAPKD